MRNRRRAFHSGNWPQPLTRMGFVARSAVIRFTLRFTSEGGVSANERNDHRRHTPSEAGRVATSLWGSTVIDIDGHGQDPSPWLPGSEPSGPLAWTIPQPRTGGVLFRTGWNR